MQFAVLYAPFIIEHNQLVISSFVLTQVSICLEISSTEGAWMTCTNGDCYSIIEL